MTLPIEICMQYMHTLRPQQREYIANAIENSPIEAAISCKLSDIHAFFLHFSHFLRFSIFVKIRTTPIWWARRYWPARVESLSRSPSPGSYDRRGASGYLWWLRVCTTNDMRRLRECLNTVARRGRWLTCAGNRSTRSKETAKERDVMHTCAQKYNQSYSTNLMRKYKCHSVL